MGAVILGHRRLFYAIPAASPIWKRYTESRLNFSASVLVVRPSRPCGSVDRTNRKAESLRKINAFIDLANVFIQDWISDKPDHEAIAVLTEIAFPDYDVSAEDVRLALRPTTVSARKAKSSGTRPK
jgi:hypothetical protein